MKKKMVKVLVGTMVFGCIAGAGFSQLNQVEAKSSTSSGYISASKAKKIALKHADLTKTQIKYVRVEMDTENGTPIYEVEFYNGNEEYDYDIDAKTGKILKYDHDIENYTVSEQFISSSKAQSIACAHAGVADTKVVFVKNELDYDDGKAIYEIEFYYGTTEYDYEIDAATGKIISYDKEIENFQVSDITTGQYISKEKALEIAKNHAKLSSSQLSGSKVKMDYDDGRMEYEVELFTKTGEYEYTLDAKTGKILEYDQDDNYDDDYYDDDDDYEQAGSGSTTDIGSTKAKEIAFKHAGTSSSSIYSLEVESDYENGSLVYEISFGSGNVEYDYVIQASTGKILEFDKEIDD